MTKNPDKCVSPASRSWSEAYGSLWPPSKEMESRAARKLHNKKKIKKKKKTKTRRLL